MLECLKVMTALLRHAGQDIVLLCFQSVGEGLDKERIYDQKQKLSSLDATHRHASHFRPDNHVHLLGEETTSEYRRPVKTSLQR